MKKYYYSYITFLANHKMYIGRRATKVHPLIDNYFGSPKKKCEEWQPTNKLFIRFTTEPIINAFNECALHSWLNVGENKRFYNKAKQTSVGFDTTGYNHTPEVCLIISKSHTGSTRNEEARLNMSRAQKKRFADSQARSTSFTFAGKTHSQEAKDKNSAAHLGIIPTLETRAKLSKALHGRIFSESHCTNIAASAVKRKNIKRYMWSHSDFGQVTSSAKELAELYNLHRSGLDRAQTGERKHHKGWVCLACML